MTMRQAGLIQGDKTVHVFTSHGVGVHVRDSRVIAD